MNHTTMTPKRKGGTKDARMNQRRTGPRFLMWVDGVGGYLVCMADEVLLGQAIANSGADIPIVGDLSRHHATIARQGENYVIRPHATTRVEGRELTSPRCLRDGDEIELGPSFRMRFRQPHPLSATSRLDFLSHHRTQPATDGVLLMANSCILGPSTQESRRLPSLEPGFGTRAQVDSDYAVTPKKHWKLTVERLRRSGRDYTSSPELSGVISA